MHTDTSTASTFCPMVSREITCIRKWVGTETFQSVVQHQLETLNERHCKPSCASACTLRAHKHSQIKLREHETRKASTGHRGNSISTFMAGIKTRTAAICRQMYWRRAVHSRLNHRTKLTTLTMNHGRTWPSGDVHAGTAPATTIGHNHQSRGSRPCTQSGHAM